MFGSNKVRARPTAAASLAGLCLWVACSSGENNFFNEPPPGSSGQSGAGSAGTPNAVGGASHGGSANQSGGMPSLGGSMTGGTSEVGGSTSGETGAGSGGTDTTGGTSGNTGGTTGNTGGTHGNTGGTGGDATATGGTSGESGAGASAGEGGVAASAGEGGVGGGAAGIGGALAGNGGSTAGNGGTSAGSGGTLAGNGGSAGASAGSAGTLGGIGGIGGAGMSGAGGTSAGAGGASSPTPCPNDGACATGQYCKKSSCNATMGVCATKPQSCTGTDATFVPVCGCDHMTYYTECVAAREGVNVAQSGECTGTTVPCTRTGGSGASCSPTRSHAACYRARSTCTGTAPDAGVCWVLPDECPTEDATNTYCNLGSPVCVGLCQGLSDNDPLWRNSSSCTH